MDLRERHARVSGVYAVIYDARNRTRSRFIYADGGQTVRLRSHSHWKCVTLCGRYERFLNAANLTEEDEEYADSGGT